jgi:CDK inhibitor PHO81
LALGILPADILNQSVLPSLQTPSLAADQSKFAEEPEQPPIFSASGQDEDRGPDFQAHKAAFFFKLERELEKVTLVPLDTLR